MGQLECTEDMNTKAQSELCAADAPVGFFGIDDILIGMEIVYYGFELWKDCHPSANTVKSEIDAPDIVRRASRSTRQATRYVNRQRRRSGLSPVVVDDYNALTVHMLHHVYTASADVVTSCYTDELPPELVEVCSC